MLGPAQARVRLHSGSQLAYAGTRLDHGVAMKQCSPRLFAFAWPASLLVWASVVAIVSGPPVLAAPPEGRELELTAAGPAAISSIGPSVELQLADGSTLVLASIVVPDTTAEAAQAALAALLDRGSVTAEAMGPADRYGRLPVQAATPDGRSLQEALLEGGLALVQPLPGAEDAVLARLLAAEAIAERAGRGVWREPAAFVVDSAVETAGQALGRFVLLEGRVLQASEQQRYLYLNFGTDWRTDTTARVDKDTRRAMQQAGFDPSTLEGRRVRLRGTLFAANGPMIELWTHQGIEILP